MDLWEASCDEACLKTIDTSIWCAFNRENPFSRDKVSSTLSIYLFPGAVCNQFTDLSLGRLFPLGAIYRVINRGAVCQWDRYLVVLRWACWLNIINTSCECGFFDRNSHNLGNQGPDFYSVFSFDIIFLVPRAFSKNGVRGIINKYILRVLSKVPRRFINVNCSQFRQGFVFVDNY